MNTGTVLREARRRAKLTQRELAERAQVAQSVVARIESGAVDPRVRTLDRLLRYCGDALYTRRQVGEGLDRTGIRELLRSPPATRLRVAEEGAEYFAGISKDRFGGGKFFDAVEVLVAHRVRFVVIGGVAAVLHGLPLMTLDTDVCYSLDRDNLKRLSSALTEIHAYPRGWPDGLPWKPDPATLDAQLVHTLKTDVGNLDCLGAPSGVTGFAQLERNAVEVRVGSMTVKVASVSDLIAMKKAADRPKDQMAIELLGSLLDEINDEPDIPWIPPAERPQKPE